MKDTDEWYLLKVADQDIFGPEPLSQFRIWASEAKIAPTDRISNDGQQTWLHATFIEDLQMDWLIEMPDGYLYGPTSVGTLQEFLATGEIDENAMVINTLTRSKARIKEVDFFNASPQRVRGALKDTTDDSANSPYFDGSGSYKERCLWLEKQVMTLNKEILDWHDRCESLRNQYIQSTGKLPL